MAKNEVLDEWIDWFRDLSKWLWVILKWAFKIFIGFVIITIIIIKLFAYKNDALFNCKETVK